MVFEELSLKEDSKCIPVKYQLPERHQKSFLNNFQTLGKSPLCLCWNMCKICQMTYVITKQLSKVLQRKNQDGLDSEALIPSYIGSIIHSDKYRLVSHRSDLYKTWIRELKRMMLLKSIMLHFNQQTNRKCLFSVILQSRASTQLSICYFESQRIHLEQNN